MLFDGAMGTYFSSLPGRTEAFCEAANLSAPETVASIHRAYLEARCMAVKTNTFSAGVELAGENVHGAELIIEEGAKLALEAAKAYGAFVFADIGPAPENSRLTRAENYCRQADVFLEQGVRCFLAETLPSMEGVPDLARHLKERCPDAFLIVSFAAAFDGTTREGFDGLALCRQAASMEETDAVGFNCMSGPRHLLELVRKLGQVPDGKFLSVMPNAGYPTVLGRRTVYQGGPDYFGEKLAEIVQAGAAVVGGCCGTTPAHIAKAAEALTAARSAAPRASVKEAVPVLVSDRNSLAEKLDAGRRIVAVELDPPADDRIGFFLEGVRSLKNAGADAVTIADCPIGRPRADSSLLACKIKRELDIEPLPHLTCRDRNLNATKALLLGLSIEGVHNVLLVTGDPIPSESRDEVKSVFNFNSRKLARFVSSLNETVLQSPFRIFGALNVNARNFDMQLKMAMEKEENGVTGFLTQPVLSREAVENLKLARQTLKGKILGGIYPVVSYKNACFLDNEIAGMRICTEIISIYKDKNREEAEDLAVRISSAVAKETEPYTDGLYLMTPFQRVPLMVRILESL